MADLWNLPGWRVMPQCRVAHHCTADGRAYRTACGILYMVPFVDFKADARQCKKCLKAMGVQVSKEPPCQIDGKPCPRHDNVVHGREAEELREGVSRIAFQFDDVESMKEALQGLLDDVDARDSLSFLERRDERIELLTKALEEMTDGLEHQCLDNPPHANACESIKKSIDKARWLLNEVST